MTTTTTSRRPATDAVLTGAIELARAAAIEVAERADHVGEHLGVAVEAERLATHRFAASATGYRGWHWAVTVSRVSRAKVATVCEAVLLPGDEALLSAPWVPYSQRLAPGDLGVGDLLATAPDDDRLEPGYTAVSITAENADDVDDSTDRVAVWELGLGRTRVLSELGRDDATDRWYSGDHGPTAPIAQAAPAPCSTCGFVVPLAGGLRRVFGVCTNTYSPSDGRVVSWDHGCGAHSEVPLLPPPVEVSAPAIDDETYETYETVEISAAVEEADGPAPSEANPAQRRTTSR